MTADLLYLFTDSLRDMPSSSIKPKMTHSITTKKIKNAENHLPFFRFCTINPCYIKNICQEITTILSSYYAFFII